MNRTSGSGCPVLMRREWEGPFAPVERIPCQLCQIGERSSMSRGRQWVLLIEVVNKQECSLLFVCQSEVSGRAYPCRVLRTTDFPFAIFSIEAKKNVVNIPRQLGNRCDDKMEGRPRCATLPIELDDLLNCRAAGHDRCFRDGRDNTNPCRSSVVFDVEQIAYIKSAKFGRARSHSKL